MNDKKKNNTSLYHYMVTMLIPYGHWSTDRGESGLHDNSVALATGWLTAGRRWWTGYLCPRSTRRWAALHRCSGGSSSGGRRGRRRCSPPPATGGSGQTDALGWWGGGKPWLIFGSLGQCYIRLRFSLQARETGGEEISPFDMVFSLSRYLSNSIICNIRFSKHTFCENLNMFIWSGPFYSFECSDRIS